MNPSPKDTGKPREWWLHDSLEEAHDDLTMLEQFKHYPEWIHVIEKSYADALERKLAKITAEYKSQCKASYGHLIPEDFERSFERTLEIIDAELESVK